MTDDPYAWIDPFEEMARAKRLEQIARNAREDGRREVLAMVAGPAQEDFQRALSHAVEYAARRVAEDVVKPHVAQNYADHVRRKHEARAMVDTFMDISSPVMGHIGRDGKLSLEMRDAPTPAHLQVRVETLRPFRYHVAMDPMAWMRRG